MLRVGIVGYGNLGRGTDIAIKSRKDIRCVGIFTRRRAESVRSITGVPVYGIAELPRFEKQIDVLINCGGSAGDMEENIPLLLERFNTVDSFDTHAKIPEYFKRANVAAEKNRTVCIYSAGWDPGLFSIARLIFDCVLPNGCSYTFWGKGVSQGHTNAIKRIDGVKNATAYTVPDADALRLISQGKTPKLKAENLHSRECYVVIENGANENIIRDKIVNMPNYFSDYKTDVFFISEAEFENNYGNPSHCGKVIRNGKTFLESKVSLGFSLKTASNPEFTGEILVSCARAADRLVKSGIYGAFNLADIPLKYLSDKTDDEIRKEFL